MKSAKEWLSISDMMAGLMMIFLFISVLYMDQIKKDSEKQMKKVKDSVEKAKEITIKYKDDRERIFEKLNREFEKDLKKWNAEIEKASLTIRFLSPDIMFQPMRSSLKNRFKVILNNFCPRYFKILFKFKGSIEEIRIEGHTSKEWKGVSEKEAYFKNMKLSQDRARAVLRHCLTIQATEKQINDWAKEKLTANGLSSSRSRIPASSVKDREKNRRVEFRVQINESRVLDEIIKEVENFFLQQSQFEPKKDNGSTNSADIFPLSKPGLSPKAPAKQQTAGKSKTAPDTAY